MLERAEIMFPGQTRGASDLWAGLFFAMLSVGQWLAPIYGGYMAEIIGFRILCDTVGWFLIAFSIVFYFVNLAYHDPLYEENEIDGNISKTRTSKDISSNRATHPNAQNIL